MLFAIIVGIRQSSCLLNFLVSTQLFDFSLRKNRRFNPYWQIMENSSRNFSEIFIFRVITQAVFLENSSIKNHDLSIFIQLWGVTQTVLLENSSIWFFWLKPYTGIPVRGGPWDGSKSLRRRCWHVKPFACNFEMAQNSKRNWIRGKNGSRVNTSFEDFLSHLKDPAYLLDMMPKFFSDLQNHREGIV